MRGDHGGRDFDRRAPGTVHAPLIARLGAPDYFPATDPATDPAMEPATSEAIFTWAARLVMP